MTELIEVDGKHYAVNEVEKIKTWVEMIGDVREMTSAEKLLCATRLLAQKAQRQYPELESGGNALLEVADTEGNLSDLSRGYQVAFVFITGDVLFSCVDGPAAGAVTLCEQIERM